jgi:hypothetical protein
MPSALIGGYTVVPAAGAYCAQLNALGRSELWYACSSALTYANVC